MLLFKLILDCIDEERDKQASLETGKRDSVEDKNASYQNIVFGQLLSIIYNMIEFKISVSSIREFIDTNAKLHALSEDFHQSVLLTINDLNDNVKFKNETKIRENLIDENKLESSMEVKYNININYIRKDFILKNQTLL